MWRGGQQLLLCNFSWTNNASGAYDCNKGSFLDNGSGATEMSGKERAARSFLEVIFGDLGQTVSTETLAESVSCLFKSRKPRVQTGL